MKRIILLGAPGSGKGTQADTLEKKYGFKKISTGDLIRAEVAAGSEIGLKVKAIMEKGELVSDEIVIEILKRRLDKDDIVKANGYILDGFPRTRRQAKELSCIRVDDEIAVYLKIRNMDIFIDRLLSRRTCPACGSIFNVKMMGNPHAVVKCSNCGIVVEKRADDNKKTIRNRFRVFRKQTRPVITYYRVKKLLRVVNASASIEDVFTKIEGVLNW
jgi:adenylate kinase